MDERPGTPSRDRLARRTKLVYGLGAFGPATAWTIIPFFFLYFLTDVANLNPGVAGVALLLAKIWDGVNDPLIGLLTDRTRTRWGRRRPYLLLGSLPFGFLFFLLWVVPPWKDQFALGLHFTLFYMLFDTALTAVEVPYMALAPELTLDYDERTSLVAHQMGVAIAAEILGSVLPLPLVHMFSDREVGFAVMGGVFAVVLAVPLLLVFAAAREREEFRDLPTLSPLASLRSVFRNRPMRYIIGLDTLTWMATDAMAAVLIYYLIYWIGLSEGEVSIMLGVLLVTALAFVPIFTAISKRLEKKWAYAVGITPWAVAHALMLAVPKGSLGLVAPLVVMAGIGISAAHILPLSMWTDVIEVDEMESGCRQEGAYSGVATFLRKMATAVALAGVGFALSRSGYVPRGTQPESALLAIRILAGPLPAVFLFAGVVLACFYPVTRASHGAMREELRCRRASLAAALAGAGAEGTDGTGSMFVTGDGAGVVIELLEGTGRDAAPDGGTGPMALEEDLT